MFPHLWNCSRHMCREPFQYDHFNKYKSKKKWNRNIGERAENFPAFVGRKLPPIRWQRCCRIGSIVGSSDLWSNDGDFRLMYKRGKRTLSNRTKNFELWFWSICISLCGSLHIMIPIGKQARQRSPVGVRERWYSHLFRPPTGDSPVVTQQWWVTTGVTTGDRWRTCHGRDSGPKLLNTQHGYIRSEPNDDWQVQASQ